MGQKINPNLFQLTKTNKWKSKYLEKTSLELSVYSRRDQEIRDFIFRFFNIHRAVLHKCKLYFYNGSLHIFVSYYSNLKSGFLVQPKVYKNYKIYSKFRIKKLFESLTSFIQNKISFFLVLKELKCNTKQIISYKKVKKKIQKNITSLRKYQKNKFFKEGINLLFNCSINKESSKLLAQFITIQLKNLKRHNFFLRFIRNALKLFKNNCFSKFKGIKIEVKGRLNHRPRARNKVIKISNSVSLLTVDSIISYSKEIAFTSNGTLGVKVWIHEF